MPYTKNITPFVSLAGFFVVAQQASAETSYLLVKDLPFIRETTDLASYLEGMFKLGIGIAVTLAVLMIVYNGIQYMFSDIPGVKVSAKGGISNVIWGLVLIFGSWLILNTINDSILRFDFIQRLNDAAELAASNTQESRDRQALVDAQEEELRKQLDPAVVVWKGACTSPTDTNCVNLKDLPPATFAYINTLAQDCKVHGCVIVTGGAEKGHVTHGPGKPFFDADDTTALNEYVKKSGRVIDPKTCRGPLYQVGSAQFWNENSHWHICLNGCEITDACRTTGGE